MINKNIKSLLLECLNENIRMEAMIYNKNMVEEAIGDTSDTGFDFTKAGTGVGAASGSGSTGGGETGSAPPTLTGPSSTVSGGAFSGGGAGSGISVKGSTGTEFENMFGPSATAVSVASDVTKLAADTAPMMGAMAGINLATGALASIPGITGIYGMDQLYRNLSNILPNQLELRKEGLGYTKGFARLQ